MSNLIGQSLGRYHILERLGEGGMAVVYKAFDTRLETDVAVKVIRTEKLTEETKERALKRFEREAKALARLTHPNIVKVTDYGDYEGKPYLVMPLLAGGTLKGRLGKPIPWDEAFQILAPIAWALEYAHGRDIIHRDVKPSNILITDSGQPMISDFGVAKILTLEETVDLTGTGMGIGTPEYMAPEQWTGNTTPHSDQYSLGVVLYEMITGRKPYTADTPAAILLKQATEPLPRPSALVSGLPEKVEKLLIKTLARDPKDRYTDMGELARALESGLKLTGSPVERAKPHPASKPTGKMLDTMATVDQEWEVDRTPQPIPASKRKTRTETKTADAQKSKSSSLPWYKTWKIMAGVVVGMVLVVFCSLTLVGYVLSRSAKLVAVNPSKAPATTVPPRTSTVTHTPVPPTFTPTPGIGSTMISEKDGMVMVFVPAGEFTMGSDAGDDDEKPVHQVYLDAFWMDQTEVTNAMYAKCVADDGCAPPSSSKSYTRDSYYDNSEFDDYPVIYVNWNQANAYCTWAGRSLPTEAQWEKAARGTDARAYPWGNTTPNSALLNYNANIGDTSKVRSYESGASPYGAYDMAGNVWEWVADWYDENYYAYSPNRNPQGPSSGEYRVLRGGSWNNYKLDLRAVLRNDSWYLFEVSVRSANRYDGNPGYILNDVGFRCARSLP